MPIPVDKLEVKGDKTCSCANPIDVKGMCKKCGLPIAKSKGKEPDADYGVGMEREKDEEVYDEDNFVAPKKKEMPNPGMAYVDEPMSSDFKKRRKARHAKKLSAMGGMKSEDDSVDTTSFDGEFDENEDYFMCAASREVKSAVQFAPCADCPGGCFSSDDSLDLIEAEYLAEETLGGKSLFSFFADDYDSFIVQLRRKDGTPVETYFSKTGEMLGWNRIPESEVYGANTNLVDIEAAIGTALGVVEGKALSISVGEFDGEECYVVEIEGVDQKSYDVVVTLDGIPLYKDEFEAEEKRLYGTEKRQEMAKEGIAMPDGGYPIKDRADLENAIQAFGRAKDKDATKAHIRKRAADLDLTDLLPEAWGAEEKVALQPSEIESALAELTLIDAQTELSFLSEEE